MNDTPKEIQAMVRSLMMKRTPAERIRMGSDMFESARRMALASLDPNATQEEIRTFLFKRIYPELATSIYRY